MKGHIDNYVHTPQGVVRKTERQTGATPCDKRAICSINQETKQKWHEVIAFNLKQVQSHKKHWFLNKYV